MLFPCGIVLFITVFQASNQIDDSEFPESEFSETNYYQRSYGNRLQHLLSEDEDPQDDNSYSDNEDNLTLRALKRALKWTMDQRDVNYGWGSDTPHTVLALSLADDAWFQANNLESQLVIKQFDIHLMLRMWKHRDSPMTSGQIALNTMTIVSLCRNPRSFYGKDLVALLEHHENRMDFEIAFADLAACNAGRRLKRSKIRRLLTMIAHKPETHSVDTLSVVILALHCAQRQRRLELRKFMSEGIDILLTHQAKDGSFASNLHSTAIALQALTSSGLSATWNVTQAQQYVMSHQLPDGSFGNIFDTNAVLPLLAGKTMLDVGRKQCHIEETAEIETNLIHSHERHGLLYPEEKIIEDHKPIPSTLTIPETTVETQIKHISHTEPAKLINMTYVIWIGGQVSMHYNLSFSVLQNTTFYQIMLMAAEKDEHFEFSASKWSSGYYIHTLSGEHERDTGFWFWLLYRLPELPVIGTIPDNKYVVGQGVTELIPNDGDVFLYWYHKL